VSYSGASVRTSSGATTSSSNPSPQPVKSSPGPSTRVTQGISSTSLAPISPPLPPGPVQFIPDRPYSSGPPPAVAKRHPPGYVAVTEPTVAVIPETKYITSTPGYISSVFEPDVRYVEECIEEQVPILEEVKWPAGQGVVTKDQIVVYIPAELLNDPKGLSLAGLNLGKHASFKSLIFCFSSIGRARRTNPRTSCCNIASPVSKKQ